MEVTCPDCLMTTLLKGSDNGSICSNCGAYLEVEEAGDGFAIIGAQKDGGIDKSSRLFRIDPIIEDYKKWRIGATFIILFGIIVFLILAISITRDILNPEFFFSINLPNLFVFSIGGVISISSLIGGIWIFRFLGKEMKCAVFDWGTRCKNPIKHYHEFLGFVEDIKKRELDGKSSEVISKMEKETKESLACLDKPL